MKKLLLALIAFFAFSFAAFAAVDLNTASKEELDAVKYIGPVKAQAIIDYRKKNGPFKSVDELKNVKGFGDKTVAKVRSDLTVGGGSFSPSPVTGKKETNSARDDAKTTKGDSKPAKDDAKHTKADNKSVNGDAAKDAKAGADNVKQSKADKKAAKKKAKEEKKAAKAKAKEDKKAADKK